MLIYSEYLFGLVTLVSNLICVPWVLIYKMWNQDIKTYLRIQAEEALFLRTLYRFLLKGSPSGHLPVCCGQSV